MIFLIILVKSLHAYHKFSAQSKQNNIRFFYILFRGVVLYISACLSINMKNNISIFSPLRDNCPFISRLKLVPRKYFSSLIIINHLLLIYLDNSCALTNIVLKIKQCFCYPVYNFLWMSSQFLRFIRFLSDDKACFSLNLMSIIYTEIEY